MTEVKQYREMFEAMETADKEFLDAGRESMPFYTGGYGTGQWEQEQLDKLESEERPPLQLNITLPKVNMVVGLEQQQRTYWKARAFGMEDEPWTQLITPCLLHLDRNGALQRKFSRVFKNGVIVGRDWLDVYVEEGADYGKDIFIERESWANVRIDPDARTDDISQWTRVAREKWFTLSELKATYPDATKDIKDDVEGLKNDLDFTPPGEDIGRERGDTYEEGDVVNWAKYIDKNRKRVRVIDIQEREWVYQYFVVDLSIGVRFKTPFNSRSDAKAFRDKLIGEGINPNVLEIIGRKVSKVYVVHFSGGRLLRERQELPYNHGQYTLVPYFFYFEDMGDKVETLGLVENLKDPQRQKNKSHSVAMDILNRSPKGGGIIDKNAGISTEELNEASSTGKWAFVKLKAGKTLRDIMQQWSTAHLQILNYFGLMEERSEIDSKEISGATDPLMGVASASKESGIAATTRIRQGLLTLEEPLNNLDQTKKRVLQMVISNMQQFWTKEKIKRIIGLESEGVNSAEIDMFIQQFKSEESLLQYDILLDKSESPTVKAIKFREMAELIKMIPSYAPALLPPLVDQSDWDSKDEIKEAIQGVQVQQMLLQQQAGAKGKA